MTKKLINSVAVTLKKLRKLHGLSQEELAYKAGLDRTYISGVERSVRNITLESVEAIVSALDISILKFIDELRSSISHEDTKD